MPPNEAPPPPVGSNIPTEPSHPRFEPREWMAALLGLGLLVAFMALLFGVYDKVDKEPEPFNRAKDLLGIVVGLLGTVLGYYFGKIPAEKSAEAARSEAATARRAVQSAEESRQNARDRVGAALALARRPPLPSGGASPGAPHDLIPLLEDARERLSR